MPRRAGLTGLFLAVLALAGCTAPTPQQDDDAPAFRGEEGRVANAIAAFQSAREDQAGELGGARTACRRVLARAVVERLDARGGCDRQVAAAFEDADPAQLVTRAVTVSGDRATAVVRSSLGQEQRDERYALVREDGTWRLAGLAGS